MIKNTILAGTVLLLLSSSALAFFPVSSIPSSGIIFSGVYFPPRKPVVTGPCRVAIHRAGTQSGDLFVFINEKPVYDRITTSFGHNPESPLGWLTTGEHRPQGAPLFLPGKIDYSFIGDVIYTNRQVSYLIEGVAKWDRVEVIVLMRTKIDLEVDERPNPHQNNSNKPGLRVSPSPLNNLTAASCEVDGLICVPRPDLTKDQDFMAFSTPPASAKIMLSGNGTFLKENLSRLITDTERGFLSQVNSSLDYVVARPED